MSVLWLAFAEDSSLPPVMDAEARSRFNAIFDASTPRSLWSLALQRLGLTPPLHTAPLIQWVGNTPYIRWSYVVSLLSGGIIIPQPNASGEVQYHTHYQPCKLPAFLRSQWNISRYILRCLEENYRPPETHEEQISESIALGLAALSLTLRLPAHTSEQLAVWLANPAPLPSRLRVPIVQLQKIQALRTRLSIAWKTEFPSSLAPAPDNTPAYFWDTPPTFIASPSPIRHETVWRGMAIAGGAVSGRAVLMTRYTTPDMLQQIAAPLILVFPLARPESVEWFEYAAGILFIQGGAMSHACTIAREQNLACITALGKGFLQEVEARLLQPDALWVSLQPMDGMVEFIPPNG